MSKAKDKSIFTITSAHKRDSEIETGAGVCINFRRRRRHGLLPVYGPEDIRPIQGSSDAVNCGIARPPQEASFINGQYG